MYSVYLYRTRANVPDSHKVPFQISFEEFDLSWYFDSLFCHTWSWMLLEMIFKMMMRWLFTISLMFIRLFALSPGPKVTEFFLSYLRVKSLYFTARWYLAFPKFKKKLVSYQRYGSVVKSSCCPQQMTQAQFPGSTPVSS